MRNDAIVKLNRMADEIERFYLDKQISAKIKGGNCNDGTVRFFLACTVGTKVSKVSSHAERIAQLLNVWNVRIYRQGAQIILEIPKEEPRSIQQNYSNEWSVFISSRMTAEEISQLTAFPGLTARRRKVDRDAIGIFEGGKLVGETRLISEWIGAHS